MMVRWIGGGCVSFSAGVLRWGVLLGSLWLTLSCAGSHSATSRPILREYRLVKPRRQLVQPTWLATYTTDEMGGRLSADGRQLLYAGNQKGNLDIWIKDLTTGMPRRLTDHVAIDTQPAWSPDEKRVVFVTMRFDAKGDIFLWQDDELTELTGRETADAYPVFSPDGRSIVFASGPEGQSRLEQLDLKSRQRRPLTGWGATHPAFSPDGKLLAYTQFDERGRGRLAVRELASNKDVLLTTPQYHVGFPAFSPDGNELYFVRFDQEAPGQPLSTTSVGSIWRLKVHRALVQPDRQRVMALSEPITSGRYTALFPQPTAQGLVFTTQRAGSLDLGLLPRTGPVPRLPTPRDQMALADAQQDPRDQLLCLFYVQAMGPSPEATAALYQSATLLRRLSEFAKAHTILQRLIQESPLVHGEMAYLAQIDAAMLPLEERHWQVTREEGSLSIKDTQAAQQALAQLALPTQPSPRVAAHLLLRQGDQRRLAEKWTSAMAAYEELIASYPEEKEHAVEAKYWLGELFARLQDPPLLTSYYLTFFRQYPDQHHWLRRAAQKILLLQHADQEQGQPGSEAERLRALVESNRDKPLFCALAQRQLATVYEKEGRMDLAIEAMGEAASRYPELSQETTAAAFELGRLSLAYSDQLRQQGRISAALRFYDNALEAYERIMKTFEPGHEHAARARAEYLRLSLLQAAQLQREKELALAEKRYQKLLTFDPFIVQGHRKLIQFGVARGEREKLVQRYEERVSKDKGDAIGYYALGYLATLTQSLTIDDLETAQTYLQRAVDLAPQSPFGHMTLGWVYEMKERFFDQTTRGWLEEAIVLYDRAYNLNDIGIDLQTEADLQVNLCNTFANLGNGWDQAFDYCQARTKLQLPFLSPLTEAAFHLTFGRTSTATGHYEVAARELEQALRLARKLGKKKLEVEAVARLALNAHLQGEYERSNEYLKKTAQSYSQQGQERWLAGLSRSEAYNLALQGKHGQALSRLARARELLAEHDTLQIEPWTPVGTPGQTSAPFGLEKLDEHNAELGLQAMIYREKRSWPEVLPLLQKQLSNRQQAYTAREKVELQRELALLFAQLAHAQHQLGQEGAFQQAVSAALAITEQLQTDEKKGYLPDPDTFPFQVALALNGAEQVLLQVGQQEKITSEQLLTQYRRLRLLERTRAEMEEQKEEKVILLLERLRLALWTDLALLSFHLGVRGVAVEGIMVPSASAAPGTPSPSGSAPAATTKGVPIPAPAAGKPGPGGADKKMQASRALTNLLQQGQLLTESVQLFRRVMEDTRPDQPVDEDREAKEEAAQERGVLARLWQPLGLVERLRWYVLAGLDLALTSTSLTPVARLEQHPSTALLQKLAALCLEHELGALRFVIAAELAYRRQDMKAMQAAVHGFLDRSPLLLDESYFSQAALLRRHIFRRGLDLALTSKDIMGALAFAEQEERRAFLDDLVASQPAGQGLAGRSLGQLLRASARYRRLLGQQDPRATEKKREAWRRRLDGVEQELVKGVDVLKAAAPRIAALLAVPAFPLDEIRQSLTANDAAVVALAAGQQVTLVLVTGAGEPRSQLLPTSLSELHQLHQNKPKVLNDLLVRGITDLLQGQVVQRLYVDLGRLSSTLVPEEVWPQLKVVRLATLWELGDAYAVRRLPLPGGLLVDPDEAAAQSMAQTLHLSALGGKELFLKKIGLPFESAPVLVWSGPLRFDGGSPANVRVLLHDAQGERLGDLRLSRSLGLPCRGDLLVIGQSRFTAGRERAERIALTRLTHAMGIPSLIFVEPGSASSAGIQPASAGGSTAPLSVSAAAPTSPSAWLPLLRSIITQRQKTDLASALHQAQKGKASPSPRLTLMGFGGMDRTEGKAFAQTMLKKRVYAGAGAFNARRLPEAVENLEEALRLIQHTGDETFLDGTLLFLAQAYTLLEDYQRAVPHMERLLALRAQAIEAAKKKNAGVLAAQAKWVDALKTMGWLRFRNEQYVRALQVNKQAIDLYHEVKRPLLARPVYDQRSIIAEKKGAIKEALTYAQRSMETAQQAQAAAPQDAGAKATVVESALRLATLQRERFSNYRAALAATRVALEHVSQVNLQDRLSLEERKKTLQGALKQAKGKAAEALKKQQDALAAQLGQLAAAIENRIKIFLEMGRIYSAKGEYHRAVGEAEKALRLAQEAEHAQDTPLLELVNNLFYMKQFERALLVAEQGLAQTSKNQLRQIQFLNAQGTIFGAQGRTADALTALEQALSIARAIKNPAEQANTYNNRGNVLYLAARFEEAKEQFGKALDLDRAQQNKLGLAFDFANLGLAEEGMGDSRAAQEHLQEALRRSRAIGAPFNELKALLGLGRLAGQNRRWSEALTLWQRGLAVANKLGLRIWSWRFYLQVGRALRQLKRPQEAQKQLEQGLAIVEEQPPQPPKALGAPKVEEEPEDLYDELVDLLARAGQAEAAFDLSERRRSRSLMDRVSQGVAKLPRAEAATLIQRISELQQELEAAHSALMRSTSGPDQTALRQESKKIAEELAAKQAALTTDNLQLATMVAVDAWPLSRLKTLLPQQPRTVIVSYYLTPHHLVSWSFHQGQLTMQVKPVSRQKIWSTIQRYREGLVHFHQVEELAQQLYRWLLAPVLEKTTPRPEQLIVVPFGPLHVLSFAALHDGQDYVVAKSAIQYLPSVNTLRFSTVGPGFAMSASDPLVSFSWSGSDRQPLSFTTREAGALRTAFNSAQLFQNEEATKAHFISKAPQAQLLHLATHARFLEETPLRSALDLADGRITLLEMMALPLKAELVILSACETGLGALDGADGMVALDRAFLAAGAKRVISSLWRVSDLGAALLMKTFFVRLAQQGSPAQALRVAQNTLRQRFPHPAFWAGFRLTSAFFQRSNTAK